MSDSSKKTPWHLRFAPGAIFQTAGLGTIYGLIFAGLLFAPLMPHLAAQSSGSSNTPQAGDEIAEIKISGVWKKIADWIKGLFGGAAGSALWDSVKAKWNAKPFTPSSGTVVAYAEVILTDLDGEKIYWYGVSGKPIAKIEYSRDDPFGYMPLREDFQYFDIQVSRMKWNADDEIYVTDNDWSRRYYSSRRGYNPDRINSRYNQGDVGAFWPEHEDYYKGKKGYLITWGTAQKHDLTHQFCSDVDENSRDDALADAAVKEKLDRFKPIGYAYLSDMRYESSGWTYTARTKPVRHQKDLSAIVDECKDVNFIPLNTRLDSFSYRNNKSTLFWKEGVTNAQPGDKIKTSSGKVIELQQAVPIPHDVPDRRIETW